MDDVQSWLKRVITTPLGLTHAPPVANPPPPDTSNDNQPTIPQPTSDTNGNNAPPVSLPSTRSALYNPHSIQVAVDAALPCAPLDSAARGRGRGRGRANSTYGCDIDGAGHRYPGTPYDYPCPRTRSAGDGPRSAAQSPVSATSRSSRGRSHGCASPSSPSRRDSASPRSVHSRASSVFAPNDTDQFECAEAANDQSLLPNNTSSPRSLCKGVLSPRSPPG